MVHEGVFYPGPPRAEGKHDLKLPQEPSILQRSHKSLELNFPIPSNPKSQGVMRIVKACYWEAVCNLDCSLVDGWPNSLGQLGNCYHILRVMQLSIIIKILPLLSV